MRRLRLFCLVFAGVVAFAAAGGAHAQPKAAAIHPVRILVPLPAGSSADVAARLIADSVRERVGAPVLVENKAGATGRIAVEALKSAPADGTTLFFAPIAIVVMGPLVLKNVNYDPEKDFVPVAQVCRFEYAFGVASQHPARAMPEFVAWARANPQRASVGNAGPGSIPHFLAVLIARKTEIELVHISYRGPAQMAVDLIGGQLAAGVTGVADFRAPQREGRIRVLATSGAKRSLLLPTVPTLREQGYAIDEVTGWHALFARPGTPQEMVDQLSAAIVAALHTPELREKFFGLGLEPTGTTPSELAAIMAVDTARWRTIVKETGFTPE